MRDGFVEHPRGGLTIRVVTAILRQAGVRVVEAIEEPINMRAIFVKPCLYGGVEILNRARRKIAARHARLIGHDDDGIASLIEAPNGADSAGDEDEILNAMSVTRVPINNSVPIQKSPPGAGDDVADLIRQAVSR